MDTLTETLQELIDPDRGMNIIEGDYTFVKVINKSDHLVPMEWNSRKYHIKPNAERLVPYFCMVHYCGDPRAFDVPGDMRRRFRSDEWQRLRTLYGVYEHTSDLSLMAQIPTLEVFTPSGKRIPTVLDDPEGTTVQDQAARVSDVDNARMEAQALREQLAKVMKRMDELETNRPTPVDSLSTPELDESRRTDIPDVSPVIEDSPIAPDDIILSAEDLLSESPPPPSSPPRKKS